MYDPKGLIREAYRIEGIDGSQCRSIFLDWALGVPLGEDAIEMIRELLQHYEAEHPDHPMTEVLREGALKPVTTRRSRRRKGGDRPQ